MKYPIGFTNTKIENTQDITPITSDIATVAPRKSLIQVYFPDRNRSYAYYNDKFDLHIGDIVYVEGKLEGLRGRVIDISYSFKIKLSDYKRVTCKADTDVKGELFMANSYLIAFDSSVIPYEKVLSWFNICTDDEEDYIIGKDDDYTFNLNNLSDMKISPDAAEHGGEYYMENKVKYISIDGNHGRAIVEDSKIYEVEFDYNDGEIANLVCNCYCINACEHSFAAMLQLQEIMKEITENHAQQFEETGYFAAAYKPMFFSFVVDGKNTGSIKFN